VKKNGTNHEKADKPDDYAIIEQKFIFHLFDLIFSYFAGI